MALPTSSCLYSKHFCKPTTCNTHTASSILASRTYFSDHQPICSRLSASRIHFRPRLSDYRSYALGKGINPPRSRHMRLSKPLMLYWELAYNNWPYADIVG